MAPLLHLSELIKASNKDAKITILQGGQSSRDLLIRNRFKDFGEMLYSTDDGSEGHHGYVTGLLEAMEDDDMTVYTCGPTAMMKGVAAIARDNNWDCQIAMEIHMACGMGACLGCSYPRAGHHEGVEKYVHVCKDGPVFKAEELWV